MDWFTSNPALMWLIIAIIFLVLEAMTVSLVTIWFVGGALFAMLLAIFHLGLTWQIVGFFIVSALLLFLARPLFRKKSGEKVRLNADSLIGKQGIVTKESTEFHTGQGRVSAQIWTIVHEDKKPLKMDQAFVVKSIDGVKLIVSDISKGE